LEERCRKQRAVRRERKYVRQKTVVLLKLRGVSRILFFERGEKAYGRIGVGKIRCEIIRGRSLTALGPRFEIVLMI
jgi:hypothetical protein